MSVGRGIGRIDKDWWDDTSELGDIESIVRERNPDSLKWDIISARSDLTEEIVRKFPDRPWNAELMKFEDV